jgi:hypothetical protein
VVEPQLSKCKALSSDPMPPEKKKKQVVDELCSKHKALSSIQYAQKRRKKKIKGERVYIYIYM